MTGVWIGYWPLGLRYAASAARRILNRLKPNIPMIDSAHSIARLACQLVTSGALLIAPSLFAAVGGPPTTDVNVVNQPTVVVTDERQPIHHRFESTSTSLTGSIPPASYVVPAGMRLTITFVSGTGVSQDGNIAYITLFRVASELIARHIVVVPPPVASNPNLGGNVSAFSQPMNFVVNAGERLSLGFVRTEAPAGAPAARVTVNVSGYLEAVQ